MNRGEIVGFVFAALQNLQETIGIMQEAQIIQEVVKQAVSSGAISGTDAATMRSYPEGYLDEETKLLVKEVIWELIFQGILAIGADNANSNYPWVRLTAHGNRVVMAGDYLPWDPDGFVDHTRKSVKGINAELRIDSTTEQYIYESLLAFRAGAYLGSVFLIGAASERVLLVLREALETAISDENERAEYESQTLDKRAKEVFEITLQKLHEKRSKLPQNLKIDADCKLRQLYHLIRLARNEAGHPTGVSFVREEAVAYLHCFVRYTIEAYKLISFLGSANL